MAQGKTVIWVLVALAAEADSSDSDQRTVL